MRKAAIVLTLAASPAAADQITVAALGDSLTEGYGLGADDGFVPQLQSWLEARGHDVVVLNAGVAGDTTAGGLARAAWTLTPDVDAMILALGANDFLRGLPPEGARENLAGILDVARSQNLPVLLAGFEAPLNFGPDYKAEFDAIYPELASEFDAILVPSFLAGLEDGLQSGITLQELLQPDGLHPTALGVSLIVEAIGPSVEDLIARAE